MSSYPSLPCKGAGRGDRRSLVKGAGVLLMAAAAALGLVACSSGSGPGTPARIRSSLSATTLATVNSFGVPVQNDHVGCSGPSPSRSISCVGTTAYSPAGHIVASFQLHQAGASCPGLLRISINDGLLTSLRTDPCR